MATSTNYQSSKYVQKYIFNNTFSLNIAQYNFLHSLQAFNKNPTPSNLKKGRNEFKVL